MTFRRHLYDFLRQRYDNRDALSAVSRGLTKPEFDALKAGLPEDAGRTSRAEYADRLVQRLLDHGFVDEALFVSLRETRGRFEDEISEMQLLWQHSYREAGFPPKLSNDLAGLWTFEMDWEIYRGRVLGEPDTLHELAEVQVRGGSLYLDLPASGETGHGMAAGLLVQRIRRSPLVSRVRVVDIIELAAASPNGVRFHSHRFSREPLVDDPTVKEAFATIPGAQREYVGTTSFQWSLNRSGPFELEGTYRAQEVGDNGELVDRPDISLARVRAYRSSSIG